MIKEAPKNIKYGRCFRLKLKNKVKLSYLNMNIYKFGLKAIESGWLDSIQINSLLRMIRIIASKKIIYKFNCSLIIPITKKPLEVRMGSGKAERKFWKCPVNKGMILIELGNISFQEAKYILKVIKHRLPFLTKMVKIIY